FIPLICGFECYGILFLGSKTCNISDNEPLNFAQTLGLQLGQAIALTKAFEQLADSKNRYHTLMKYSNCAIFVFNLQGKILEVNKQGQKLLQRSAKEILGQSYLSFVAKSELKRAVALFEKLLKDGYLDVFELRMVKNGSEVMVEVYPAKVITKNEALIFTIINDVTERHQLRAQAMLHDRLAVTGTMIASIAHEINNPIAWILSNLSYLKKKFEDFKNKEQDLSFKKGMGKIQNVIDESLQGANRIQKIIHLFKNFARTAETDQTSVDIHEILRTAIDMASLEYKYRAKIEKKFANNLPLITANSGQLHQVFLNLLINAAQSIKEGDIEHNSIKIKTSFDSDNVCIDIKDTGAGIHPDVLSHIFDPFFTTKPAGTGTGLGLSICYEIIRNLGGKITVQSDVGKGALFRIHLPIQRG
ncbi:TPA: PAS domain S-box protein, partial [Legionella pneumophila]|nr:PAS domain S-box protein [Legionella pneumophila]